MNKRILKKLCKRAHGELLRIGYPKDTLFFTDRTDPPSWSWLRMDRKHLDDWCWGANPDKHPPRANRHGYFQALPSTAAVGYMAGYEEPEWEDWPAYECLLDIYGDEHTTYHLREFIYFGVRDPKPPVIFRWAATLPDNWLNGGATDGLD